MIGEYTASDVVFFFQAEDGIRDYKVTGVQTCALPIFPIVPATQGINACSVGPLYVAATSANQAFVSYGSLPAPSCPQSGNIYIANLQTRAVSQPTRSEERRVGKECRSRWSPYH